MYLGNLVEFAARTTCLTIRSILIPKPCSVPFRSPIPMQDESDCAEAVFLHRPIRPGAANFIPLCQLHEICRTEPPLKRRSPRVIGLSAISIAEPAVYRKSIKSLCRTGMTDRPLRRWIFDGLQADPALMPGLSLPYPVVQPPYPPRSVADRPPYRHHAPETWKILLTRCRGAGGRRCFPCGRLAVYYVLPSYLAEVSASLRARSPGGKRCA
jgi:hypothetical protein